MRLYFTGATKFLAAQNDPQASLGYFISSSALPNGSINNLFGSLSQYTLDKGGREVRALALKNETGSTITGAQLFYDMISNEPLSNYKMAVVLVGVNSCSEYYLEKVNSFDSLPINATFIDNKTVNNAITLPAMPNNSYLGIWIIREINKFAAANANKCETLFTKANLVETSEVFTIQTVADIAGSLGGTYFTFDTPQSKFYVWYDTGASTNPLIAGREGIRVSITSGDSADTVATKTQLQLQLLLNSTGNINSTVALNVITVTNLMSGNVPSPNAQTSGFTLTTTIQGISATLEKVEDVLLTISW